VSYNVIGQKLPDNYWAVLLFFKKVYYYGGNEIIGRCRAEDVLSISTSAPANAHNSRFLTGFDVRVAEECQE
jgi:hypothetical protein